LCQSGGLGDSLAIGADHPFQPSRQRRGWPCGTCRPSVLIEAKADAGRAKDDDHGGRRSHAISPRLPLPLPGDDPPEHLRSRIGSISIVKHVCEIEIVHHQLQSPEDHHSRIRKVASKSGAACFEVDTPISALFLGRYWGIGSMRPRALANVNPGGRTRR
jgi:hypothetical protein